MQQVATLDDLKTTTFGGRRFTRQQLQKIIDTVKTFQNLSRKELALTIAEHFSWKNASKALKVNSSLTLLENLESLGLVKLPAPRETKQPKTRRVEVSPASNVAPIIEASLEEIGPIELQLVSSSDDTSLFNELVQRHHYLGYRQTVGQSLRYFIVAKGLAPSQGKVGCLLFTPASFALKARDEWIGWKRHHRAKRLPFVVCNRRFLILPWLNVPNLASKSLSLVPERLTADWRRIYGVPPVLVETFVNPEKFTGACYRAANWQHLGQTSATSGYRESRGDDVPKEIYVYPLHSDCKSILTGKKPWPPKEEIKPTKILERQSFPDEATEDFTTMWGKIVATLAEVAGRFDGKWQRRKRVIDSLMLVMLIFRLVGTRARRGYGSVIDEMWDNCDKVRIALPQRDTIAISSFGNARLKLDELIFKEINARIVALHEAEIGSEHLWHGRRVFAVDGTKVNLPRALVKNGYSRPTPSAHYPQGLGSCLYNVMTRMPHDFGLYSYKDERRCAREHLKTIVSGDVVVYDRGYFSYAMLHRHLSTGVHAVFRLKRKLYSVIEDFWASAETDNVITLMPEGNARTQIERVNPKLEIKPLQLRLVKYCIDGKSYCLATTLMDVGITEKDFQDVYHARWGVEELYKISKQILSVEQFHAKSERGVKQEFYAQFALISVNRTIAHYADRTRPEPIREPLAVSSPPPRRTNFKSLIANVLGNLESLLYSGATFIRSLPRVVANAVKRFLPVRDGRKFPRISHRMWNLRWTPAPPKSQKKGKRILRGRRERRIAGAP